MRTLALLVLLLTASLTAPQPTVAQQVFKYAGQYATNTFTGIDGYIRVSGTTMVDPYFNHHATWIDLCPGTSCSSWIQTGQYQGTVGTGTCPGSACVRSITYAHGYLENMQWCGEYDIDDTGDEHLHPNVPYYISRVGTGVSSCNDTDWKYAFRSDSFSNPPDGYGYLSSSSGVPLADTELYADPSQNEPLGQDRIGLDNNNQENGSYSLHLLSGGSWTQWNATSAPGTTVPTPASPLHYYGVKAYSSFRTDDQ